MAHEVKVREITTGKRTRMSFSSIDEVMDMPDLIEVQKKSYQQFLEVGFREVLADISPIRDYTNTLSLELVDYTIEKTPKYSVADCKERDVTYAAPLKVKVQLINRQTGEVKEQEVFMGDFPFMTDERHLCDQRRRAGHCQPAPSFPRSGLRGDSACQRQDAPLVPHHSRSRFVVRGAV